MLTLCLISWCNSSMNFKTYFLSLGKLDRLALAKKCHVSVGHLQNISYGARVPSAALCVLIEQTTKVVTRKDLLPDDWESIWPELRVKAARDRRKEDRRVNTDRRISND